MPGDNPNLNQTGLVLSGFVERVGDPVPLVAADGSPHRGELVLVEALDAMARTVGGGARVSIAVPAHWSPGPIGALRGALRTKPGLAPNGVPAALVPDSMAALAALRRLADLSRSEDERIALAATQELLNRAFGRTAASASDEPPATRPLVIRIVRFSDIEGEQEA